MSVVWGTTPTGDIGRRTNTEGAFQVGLGTGRYCIRATASGAEGEVEAEGGPGEEIVIRLRPPEPVAGQG